MKNMNFKGCRVLLLDSPGRQTMSMLHDLHELKCEVTTISCSKFDNGFVSHYPAHKIIEPKAQDDPQVFQQVIEREISSGKYDVLIAQSDPTTRIITEHYEEFKKHVRLTAPPIDVYRTAADKYQTMALCRKFDIPAPYTLMDDEPMKAFLGKTSFPIAVKPRFGFGSIGFHKISTEKELEDFFEHENIKDYVVQEYIEQTDKQINVHLFRSAAGTMNMSVVMEKARYYPIDGGSCCLGRTIHDEKIMGDCARLLEAMKWTGYCEVELIVDPRDHVAKVMEVNGRLSACVKVASLAGCNVARLMLEEAYGVAETIYLDYKDDVRMRCSQTDLLWFIQSKNRFHSEPSWFSLKNTHDQIFSVRDPLPWFTYSVDAVFRFRREIQRRKR